MIDRKFLPEAIFGFRLLGSGLQGLGLPASFNIGQFFHAAGEVMLDGNGTVLLEFSADSIVDTEPVPPPCLKKSGRPDKHCSNKTP
jgi:hypothetical protein